MPLNTSYSPKPSTLDKNKTKEKSCSTCKYRRVRCSGGRPACSHCLKVSSAQGIPPEGVICLYSAKSMFAKEEDFELEARFGKADRCLWSHVPIVTNHVVKMGMEEKTEEDIEMVKEEDQEMSNFYFTQESMTPIRSPSPSPSSSRSTTPSNSTAPSSPLQETLCPSFGLSDLAHDDSNMDVDLIPEIDWDAQPVRILQNPFESYEVPIPSRSPSPLPFPIPALPLPAGIDTPEAIVCPANIDAAFWAYGPISSQEIEEWEGIRYVANQIVRR